MELIGGGGVLASSNALHLAARTNHDLDPIRQRKPIRAGRVGGGRHGLAEKEATVPDKLARGMLLAQRGNRLVRYPRPPEFDPRQPWIQVQQTAQASVRDRSS